MTRPILFAVLAVVVAFAPSVRVAAQQSPEAPHAPPAALPTAPPSPVNDAAIQAQLVAIDARRALLVSDPDYRTARRRALLGVSLGGGAAALAVGSLFLYPFTFDTDSGSNLRMRHALEGMMIGGAVAALVGFGFALSGVAQNQHRDELRELRRTERVLQKELHRRRVRLALAETGLTVRF
jgi:hypothetical protein